MIEMLQQMSQLAPHIIYSFTAIYCVGKICDAIKDFAWQFTRMK